MVTDDEMIAHNAEQGRHLDKRIGVAHILTTVSLLVGLGSVLWALETRVTAVEHEVITNREVMNIEIANIKDERLHEQRLQTERFGEIKVQLMRIENKVDRHSENAINHAGKN